MKKLFLGISISAVCVLSSAICSAYAPSTGDTQQVNLLNAQLDIITTGDMQDVWNFYSQIKVLVSQFSGDEKLNWMLSQLNGHLMDKLTVEKNKAKITSKQFKQDFLTQYLTGEIQDIPDLLSCTGRYNTLDTISFAYNFPTALTIATRYREANCGYYLPANGNGPFQIISKNYGTGAITEDIFTKSVVDFVEFAKYKINRYEKANKAEEHPEFKTNLSYTGYDFTGVVRFGALYNSLSGNTVYGNILPKNPKYVFDGYGDAFSGALRYGLMPKFLKTLQREIANQY